MNRLILLCLSLVLLLVASPAFCDDAALARLFSDRKVNGTLLIANLDGTALYLHDAARASTPLLPASTFKFPNTLIALDEGVITEKELLKWDGTERGLAACNRDQTLASAFKNSCVWCYQQLAQRVGTARYQHWLKQIDYGNANPGPELTTFWLSGDLRISAQQQITFLQKLYKHELPFKPASYDALRRIMLVEEKPGYRLYAKTGWAGYGEKATPQIGWYVGYVETGTDVWFFALNMAITKPADGAFRQQMVMEALKLKGIL
ncbi:beta-lactamase class D [Trichlorobacter thiogenes]|uniref:beta-lactamase n=1 Tax=Trichlorobacter thiogenes TaxID=115783 RepID=A0A1T4KDD4_9BACT|nr:class D beta-lactamase [Trichlorobacter thiogenes]SJZ40468.1 beta-lactamase class D [Trichlorobacter thiogenes]